MASRINSTRPADGVPSSKSDLREALDVIRTEIDHGGFAESLTPTHYGPLAGARVVDHLAAIDSALGRRAGAGTGPAPHTVAACPGVHVLTAAERADANVLVVTDRATDLRIPADARAGSVWLVDVATPDPVTVSVAGAAGSVNDERGGAITAAGAGASLVVWIRANPDGRAPAVRVTGDTAGTRALAGDLDGAGHVIAGYADGTDTGDLAGAALTPADRGRVKVHTGGSGRLTVPDIGDGVVEVVNDGSGTLALAAAGGGPVLEGDTKVHPGESARIRLFTGAGAVRKARAKAG